MIDRNDQAERVERGDMEKYLTPDEVSSRYSGRITVKTLSNWRAMEEAGPDFVKMGGRILYALSALVSWERRRVFKSTRDYGAPAAQV